jgi:hypothetical protein
VAIVRSGDKPGSITLRATSPGLPAAEVAIAIVAAAISAR